MWGGFKEQGTVRTGGFFSVTAAAPGILRGTERVPPAAGTGRALVAPEAPRGGREPPSRRPRHAGPGRLPRQHRRRPRRRQQRRRILVRPPRRRHLPRLPAQRLQARQALPLPAPRHLRGHQPGRAQERVHLLPRLPEQGVRAPQLPLHPRHQGGRGLLQEDRRAAAAPAPESGGRAGLVAGGSAQQQRGGADLQGFPQRGLPARRQVQVPAFAAGLRVRGAGKGAGPALRALRRPLRARRAGAEAAASRGALRELRVRLRQPARRGVPAAGGGERAAQEARGGPQEAGQQPAGHQRGAAGAERPIPQPGQGDDAELHGHGQRAAAGAHGDQLQPQHRPDSHHAQQPGPAAPPGHPAGFGGAGGRSGRASRQRSPVEPRDRAAVGGGGAGADHRAGHGAAARVHGARGRVGGAGGREHGAAARRHHHEPRHHAHGHLPHRLAEHEDNGHAALTAPPAPAGGSR